MYGNLLPDSKYKFVKKNRIFVDSNTTVQALRAIQTVFCSTFKIYRKKELTKNIKIYIIITKFVKYLTNFYTITYKITYK